ncbi:hypothetical protein KBJ98_02105 [Flavobacterium sp. F-328]|uniref:Uncharacterized protein n=1 Tax=Flavobacterium erciyesense TaxID=2825842 RepID=A0ABS5D0E2_9FLAO|nr:hypothetical protein [Flavobacterium erciyesense]MBQ0907489.1 hypothetical protein [Flavobacterium erciyesense]
MLEKIKIAAIVILLVTVSLFYKNWQFEKAEKTRQTANLVSLRKADSLNYATQILNVTELKEYLQYQNSDLKNKLAKSGIKENRITEIIRTNYIYKDTIKQETDVSGLIDAVKKTIPKQQSWSDTNGCLTVKGLVVFDGQKLKVTVQERDLKNNTHAVAYWERKPWTFLGLKSRFLGKKQFTAKVFDECGKTQFLRIEKKQ